MKTLLVVPEIRLDSKPTIVPFWAGILASIIENKNGQVAILDLNALRMKFGGKQVPTQVIIDEISSENWNHKYSRNEAAFPHPFLLNNKYWCPVSRIDNVYGDRNLFCVCPPIEDYDEASNA